MARLTSMRVKKTLGATLSKMEESRREKKDGTKNSQTVSLTCNESDSLIGTTSYTSDIC